MGQDTGVLRDGEWGLERGDEGSQVVEAVALVADDGAAVIRSLE